VKDLLLTSFLSPEEKLQCLFSLLHLLAKESASGSIPEIENNVYAFDI
jgi:hypothetical protein